MRRPFDIFWYGEGGPNWIEAVDTLEIAKNRIEKLPQATSGSYAVLDRRTGNRISFAENSTIRETKTRHASAG